TIDPEQVSRITVVHDRAATTQPTTQPAAHDEWTIERTKQSTTTAPTTNRALAPTLPSTGPTTLASAMPSTAPATSPTTAPTTAPPEPPSKWQVTSSPAGTSPANDRRVQSLLGMLHPLRAVRYLESTPSTQPADQYILTIDT